jgi:hypothetical protein
MNHRYVHVSLGYQVHPWDPKIIDPIASQVSTDWIRYTPSTWICWTDKNLVTISDMFRTKLDTVDHIMVHAMDRSELPCGIMPMWIWDWVNLERDAVTGKPISASPLALAHGISGFLSGE